MLNASSLHIEQVPPRVTGKLQIGSLTAMRFVALLGVIFDHLRGAFHIFPPWLQACSFHQAVSFFFMLSGFVLARNYETLPLERKSYLKFQIARFAKLWPSHVLTLLFLVIGVPEVFRLHNSEIPVFLANLFLLQAWVPVFKTYFSYNAPAWTSSVFLFCYLAFPFLIAGMRKNLLVYGAPSVESKYAFVEIDSQPNMRACHTR